MAGHRFCAHVYARREADAAPGYPHAKYYEWRHAIQRDHEMYEVLQQAMPDLDHFCGGFEPSVDALRATFRAHLNAAVTGGSEGYRRFLNNGDVLG